MVEYRTGESFVQIVYAKVHSNGKTTLVPMKLQMDGSLVELNSSLLKSLHESGEDQQLLANRYEIQRILGQGGFGRTYLALDRHRFNEPCVVKEFLPQSQGEYEIQKSRQLFEREAKILYQIDLPQIPKFLATFEEDERLFLVQEYIQGKTYSSLLRERQQRGQTFSEAEILKLFNSLLPVLSYIHDRQIVHRDISPDNLMLQEQSQLPMLIDFGIGKSAAIQGDGTVAQTSYVFGRPSIVGKIGYAPQEQLWMAQSYPNSDLYALAMTAIVLLTGEDPQSLTNQQSLKSRWASYVRVSSGLAQVLNRMLHDNPAQRYPSAEAVMADLDRLDIAPPTQVSKPSVSPQITTLVVPPVAPAPRSTPITSINDLFVSQCERELLTYIGPVAKFLVRDTVAKAPHLTPAELVDTLANHIPNDRHAIEFHRRLLSW
jgi:serine/threonine protein kinase